MKLKKRKKKAINTGFERRKIMLNWKGRIRERITKFKCEREWLYLDMELYLGPAKRINAYLHKSYY